MMNRRTLLLASAAMGAVSFVGAARTVPLVPLRAEPRHRRIFASTGKYGCYRLESDGPAQPRKIVRKDVIERTFGEGTYDTLTQPDHWRMIDAGWFGGDDLHQPIPIADEAYDIWWANHHPMVEAHDILADLFPDLYVGFPFGSGIRKFGVEMAEHPCSPRFVTADVDSDFHLIRLADEVAARSDLISIVLPPEVKVLRTDPSYMHWLEGRV